MNEREIFRTETINVFRGFFFILAVLTIAAMFAFATLQGGSPWRAFELFRYRYYLFVVFAAAFIVFGLLFRKHELIITDVRVVSISRSISSYSRVELPVNKITAIGRGASRSVSASTSGGKIFLLYVMDRDGAFKALSEILTNNATKTSVTPQQEFVTPQQEQ